MTWQFLRLDSDSVRVAAVALNPRRHPTCWASSQRSHTISRKPCHGAWTSAPLSTHPSIGCSCMAPQIETPICTRCTTTHEFFWQQQHTCGAVGRSSMECGVGGQPHKTPHFNYRHRYTHPRNDPPKKSLGPAQPPPYGCFRSCLYKWDMASSASCECGAEQTVDHVVLHCPIHRPPSRTTRPDGSGRWDNRMAAQHLPRYLVGLAVDKRTRSNERRRRRRFWLDSTKSWLDWPSMIQLKNF